MQYIPRVGLNSKSTRKTVTIKRRRSKQIRGVGGEGLLIYITRAQNTRQSSALFDLRGIVCVQ